MIVALIVLSLPITIIGANFDEEYNDMRKCALLPTPYYYPTQWPYSRSLSMLQQEGCGSEVARSKKTINDRASGSALFLTPVLLNSHFKMCYPKSPTHTSFIHTSYA